MTTEILPAAVVAGAFQTGVVLMRNLHRQGVKVYTFDIHDRFAGFKTRYAEASVCPNPDEHPEQWLAWMKALSKRIGGRPILIASADRFVSAMGRFRDELADDFRYCLDGVTAQAKLATKEQQYALAALQGMPVPRTEYAVNLEQVKAFAEDARYPCLFKPRHEREWGPAPAGHLLSGQKLVLASSREDLLAKYKQAQEVASEVVLQELIEGPDTAKMVYLSCYSKEGRRLGWGVVKQLRTAPILFGSASVVEPVMDAEAADLCDRFLRSIDYRGLCEIEIKRDSRDGRVMLIEANPRFSVTADAAQFMGVDVGWIHYQDLAGVHLEEASPRDSDFRHIVLRRDFECIPSYLSAGLWTWGQILKSYRRPVYFFDLDWRDVRVCLDTVWDLVKLTLKPVVRRYIPKRV
jgi:D-aspartate ligase